MIHQYLPAALAGISALLLASCGKEDATPAETPMDEVAFESEEPAGDVTAIDAATNADAQMAPDEPVDEEDTDDEEVEN